MDNNEEKQKSLKELWSFPFVAIIGILFSVSSSELVRNNTVLKCVFIAVLLLWAVLFVLYLCTTLLDIEVPVYSKQREKLWIGWVLLFFFFAVVSLMQI